MSIIKDLLIVIGYLWVAMAVFLVTIILPIFLISLAVEAVLR